MLSGMVTESEEDSEEIAARQRKRQEAAKAKARAKKIAKGEPLSEDEDEKPAPEKKVGMSFRHLDFNKLAAEADTDSSGDDDRLLAQYWGDEPEEGAGGNGQAGKRLSGQATFAGLKKKLATSAAALKTKITSSK